MFAQLDRDTQRRQMEATIREYFQGCNDADVAAMAATFAEDAVHYFPPGLDGPWRGSQNIAENWRTLVLSIGSAWTIDRLIVEPESLQAVIEWTHYKTRSNTFLRGDEWYKFDPASGLISEIRAFYAASSDGRDHVELQGYDYAAEGYHLSCPVARPHPDADYPAPEPA